MPMTDAQLENKSRNVAREFTLQSKNPPLYINIHDGRLVPNVLNTRKNPDYRPYHGDPDIDVKDRLAALERGQQRSGGVRVTSSRPVLDVETFDVSSAKKAELLAFAADEYPDLELDPGMHPMTMRKLILAASERAAAAAPAEDMT